MAVLVARCESAVPDDEFEINGTHIDERYLTHEANEWDEYALEAAVGLADTHGDVDVVTVTIGPERTEKTIREGSQKAPTARSASGTTHSPSPGCSGRGQRPGCSPASRPSDSRRWFSRAPSRATTRSG
jgi:hypothetical protein